jgi:hypothetical protein
MMEALVCHPLGKFFGLQTAGRIARGLMISADTIKVRMQLSKRARAPGVC